MTIEMIGQQLADLHRDLVRSHPPEVMTPPEAAEYIGVTTETLFRWRKDGCGPKFSQPNPRIVRYLRDDLVTFLKEYRA
ncbi:helix-turn-helix transcriptional regulator [Acidimangrovimonas sediminis]|uniref:helix-turn-helix transcriptional regulator n=1 Tax=Acidimangrovimonas sediminis TaxID=2056283 RepID=UPI000C7FB118|nr:helix-turn-helix domain-containing protein [Acidimangrovimonas sediminis]